MKPFRKLRVLDEDEYQRLQERSIKEYDPKIRTMAFLQTEIDQLLSDPSLSSSDKLRLFQMAQNRLMNLKQQKAEDVVGPVVKFVKPARVEPPIEAAPALDMPVPAPI